MNTETGILLGAVGGLVLIAALVAWLRVLSKRDRQVFRQMEPIMEDLQRPLRFLADLRSVWPDLTDEQRAEIETSSTYQNKFHETIARAQMDKLTDLARRLRSLRYRHLRKSILRFIHNWETQEPDSLKIIQAMVKREAKAA